MGRNLDDVIQSLPAKRQAKIAALSQKKIEDMIAHAATLTDFRKAVGKTQAEVARELGINQNAVSQLEKRSDTYVSTLRRFLKTLGLSLELSVTDNKGVRIDLQNFPEGFSGSAANDAEASAVVTRAPARRAAMKAVLAKTVTAKAKPVKKSAPTAAFSAPTATKKGTSARTKESGVSRKL